MPKKQPTPYSVYYTFLAIGLIAVVDGVLKVVHGSGEVVSGHHVFRLLGNDAAIYGWGEIGAGVIFSALAVAGIVLRRKGGQG